MAAQTLWWVYMVRARSGALYTGITTDVAARFRAHCLGPRAGGAKFFGGNPAEEVVYREACAGRGEAGAREYRIKKMSRAAKTALIAGQSPRPPRLLRADVLSPKADAGGSDATDETALDPAGPCET